MWLVWESLTILIVAALSGLILWIVVRLMCLSRTAKLRKEIEQGLPRNGNEPALSVLLQNSPRDTGTFEKLQE